MKKLLLATVLSMAATAVCAEPTAMLKVQGSLTSAGCVPEISNGGLANFGEIGFDFKPVDDVTLMAAYSRSNLDTKDSAGNDVQKYGLFTEVKYKNADWNVRNSYDVYLNYRNVGAMSIVSTDSGCSKVAAPLRQNSIGTRRS